MVLFIHKGVWLACEHGGLCSWILTKFLWLVRTNCMAAATISLPLATPLVSLKKPKKMKQKQEIFSSPPGTLQDPLIFLVWPVSKLRTQRKEQPGFWPLLPSDKTQVYTVLTCGNHQLHCIGSYHLEFIKEKKFKILWFNQVTLVTVEAI